MKEKKEQQIEISVVIPLYNEEKGLEQLYTELKNVLAELNKSYEIIFVDDGSKDGSFEVLERIYQHDSSVKVIKFRRNFGKTSALDAGFSCAKGTVVFTMDADLQDNPQDIPLFLAEIEKGNHVVVGWRISRKDTLAKRIYSKIFNGVTSSLAGFRLNDFNCPLKAFKQEVIQDLNIYGEMHRFIPVLADKKGYKIAEIKISNRPRKYGRSKYGIERLWRGFFDAVTVLFIGRYSEKPLHFFGGISLILLLLGVSIDLFVVLRKFFVGITFEQSAGILTLSTILISAAFNLFAVGLITEFILNRTSVGKKLYTIEKVLGKERVL